MKTLKRIGRVMALFAAFAVGTPRGNAQGTILFDTLVPGIVDARWWLSRDDDFPFAQGWIAQLMVGPVDPLLPLGSGVQPVFPTTTFRPSDDPERGYVNPVVVTVPHLPPGSQAVVYMIAYPDVEPRPPFSTGVGGATIITLGGGDLPPAFLTGMPGVAGMIPEPSPLALIGVGAGLFLLARLLARDSVRSGAVRHR